MTLRITPHRQFEIGQLRARSQISRTAALRDQISSGVRIHRPSDDPRAQQMILNLQAAVNHFQSQSQAVNDVRSVLDEAQSQIRSAQQLLVKARDIGLQIRQINNASEATVFAREINGILETLDSIANTKQAGQYLFAGSLTQNRPFPNVVDQTNYQGGPDSGSVQIAGAGHIRAYYSGEYVFSTGIDGVTLVRGNTGATGGTGTASGHGTGELIVGHTSTSIPGTSGLRTGTSSSAGDTIIGTLGVHRFQIVDTSGTGASGTISLNGGTPVTFTDLDENLQVTGPTGELTFVDTTSIAAGFSGFVDVTADGTLSMDGGLTQVPIDFSQNQTLVDEHGNVRHVNSQGITQTGADTVRLTGNSDVFETLRSLRDDLLRNEEFSAAEWDETVTNHLGDLELAGNHLLDIIGEQSVDLQTLDRLQERGEDLQLASQKRLTELQGTDFADAVLQLQEEQNLTQYTFAALAGVFQVSVLDFLR